MAISYDFSGSFGGLPSTIWLRGQELKKKISDNSANII